jgi:hypothetical protein
VAVSFGFNHRRPLLRPLGCRSRDAIKHA